MLRVRLQTSGRTLGAETTYPLDLNGGGLAIGDLNDDGRNDVVAGTGSSTAHGFHLFTQNAAGVLERSTVFTDLQVGASVRVADLNHDSRSDLLMSQRTVAAGLYLFLQQSDGTLGSPITLTVPAGIDKFAVGDLNGDGRSDVATVRDRVVTELLQGPAGGFTVGTSVSMFTNMPSNIPSVQVTVSAIVTGDFNGDGFDDISVPWGGNPPSNGVHTFYESANGLTTPTYVSGLNDCPRAPVSADFDQDGFDDLAVVNGCSISLDIFAGRAGGLETSPTEYGVADPQGSGDLLAVGDLDGDGLTDLAAVNFNHGNDILRHTAAQISGTVTNTISQAGVAGAWVAALHPTDMSVVAGTVADEFGRFAMDVPVGSYLIYLVDPSGDHVAGFRDPLAPIEVRWPGLRADPAMEPTQGSITATVTETGTGAPVGGVWGLALSASAGNTGATEAAATANGSGQLTLPGLRAGNHYVGFIDPTGAHAARFFPNSPNVPDSTPVTVTAGNATAANASLPTQTLVGTGSTISGTVTEAGTNAPLANGRVLALRAADYQIVRAAATNASGQYTLNLAAGDYKLAFLDATGGHDMEWFDNLPLTALPSAVSVTAPGTANAALNPNTGTMAGTIVDDPAATPLAGAWAIAIGPTGIAGGAVTAANGTYTLGGLATGTYRATFVDPNGGRTQEYWDNSPTYAGATTFNITAANTTTINAALHHP